MKTDDLFQKRIQELAQMAYYRDMITFTDFLTLNELHMVNSQNYKGLGVTVKTFGGYEFSERQIAAFIPDALSYVQKDSEPYGELPGQWSYPFCCLYIQKKSIRHGDALNHRDYLGALLNLGIERSMLGDILVKEEGAYVFCMDTMADYIRSELTRVRHTTVYTELVSDLSELPKAQIKEIKGVVASVRLDAICALAFSTSRSGIVPFIEGGKVYVNGKQVTSNGYTLKGQDVISVRGKGKYRYIETQYQTKKGRYSVLLHRFI